MKTIWLLCLFFLPLFVLSQATVADYNTKTPDSCGGLEAILQNKGSWKKTTDDLAFPDKSFPASQYSQVNTRTKYII
ncbi:MAG: hypothetical protein ACJ749_14775, partial [Flavisolibacter sp.]